MEKQYYIGLLSGTSVDAIDAVLADFSSDQPRMLASHSHPIPSAFRKQLLDMTQPQENELHTMLEADTALGILMGDAVNELMKKTNVLRDEIRAIGSHGQTLRHQPTGKIPYTLQIGDPNQIVAKTKMTTVADFRRLDIAFGGQGAPLAPAFHEAVFRDPLHARAIINIGGFSNMTILAPNKPTVGFDIGPGNALIDGWIQECLNKPYDAHGEWGAKGSLILPLLERFKQDPFFAQKGPKSTGKDFFHISWVRTHLAALGLETSARAQDIQYTLTELTANLITDKIKEYPEISSIYICGGGAANTFLMSRIANGCAPIPVHTTSDLGIPPDWVEGMLFAWLAKQRMEGKALSLASITGSSKPVLLGGIYSPA